MNDIVPLVVDYVPDVGSHFRIRSASWSLYQSIPSVKRVRVSWNAKRALKLRALKDHVIIVVDEDPQYFLWGIYMDSDFDIESLRSTIGEVESGFTSQALSCAYTQVIIRHGLFEEFISKIPHKRFVYPMFSFMSDVEYATPQTVSALLPYVNFDVEFAYYSLRNAVRRARNLETIWIILDYRGISRKNLDIFNAVVVGGNLDVIKAYLQAEDVPFTAASFYGRRRPEVREFLMEQLALRLN
jgi:hypothetical protein